MTHLTSKPNLNRIEWVALGAASIYYLLRRAAMYGGFALYAYLYHRWSGIAEQTGQTYETVANAEVQAFSESLANWITAHGRLGIYLFVVLTFGWALLQIGRRFSDLEDAIIRFWEARLRTKAVILSFIAAAIWVKMHRAQVVESLTTVFGI